MENCARTSLYLEMLRRSRNRCLRLLKVCQTFFRFATLFANFCSSSAQLPTKASLVATIGRGNVAN